MIRAIGRYVDWRFLLSLAAVLAVATVAAGVYASEMDRQAKTKRIDTLVSVIEQQDKADRVERAEAAKERQRLLDGQTELRERHERLLEYLRTAGINVPASVYRTTTRDDDDGGDTNVTVRPQSSNSSSEDSSAPSPSPSASNDDSNVTDVVPEIPLPAPAGEATDTAKRIIEDVTGMVTE